MPFASLDALGKGYVVGAIKKARLGTDFIPLTLGFHDSDYDPEDSQSFYWPYRRALQITEYRDRPFVWAPPKDVYESSGYDTRVVLITPSSNGNDVNYTFNLRTSGTISGNSIYKVEDADTYHNIRAAADLLTTDSASEDIFSISKDDYTAKTIDLSFDESYEYNVIKNYQVLTAEVDTNNDKRKDATLHAELWTNLPVSSTTDYMVGGFWLLVPKDLQDTESWDFGAFVRGENPIPWGSVNSKTIGKATYKGLAVGLHTSIEDKAAKISRLLGKVTIDANFEGTAERGNFSGKIHDLSLDGISTGGGLILQSKDLGVRKNRAPFINIQGDHIGNINGVNYTGSWGLLFQIPGSRALSDAAIPGGVVGTIGGTGSNGNTVVASFGAKKVEDGE